MTWLNSTELEQTSISLADIGDELYGESSENFVMKLLSECSFLENPEKAIRNNARIDQIRAEQRTQVERLISIFGKNSVSWREFKTLSTEHLSGSEEISTVVDSILIRFGDAFVDALSPKSAIRSEILHELSEEEKHRKVGIDDFDAEEAHANNPALTPEQWQAARERFEEWAQNESPHEMLQDYVTRRLLKELGLR